MHVNNIVHSISVSMHQASQQTTHSSFTLRTKGVRLKSDLALCTDQYVTLFQYSINTTAHTYILITLL